MDWLLKWPSGHLLCLRRSVWRYHVIAWLSLHVWIFGSVGGLSSALANGPLSKKRATQLAAERSIPWTKLKADSAAKLRAVVAAPSLYRRMPTETISCESDLFVFLVRHPEVMVGIWQHMGITRCTVTRIGKYEVQASDGAGTQSRVELVYSTTGLHVLYVEGEYTGSLTKQPIRGRGVILVQNSTEPAAEQPATAPQLSTRMDVFLKLDHRGAEVIAKALHPIIGRTADMNFRQSVKFVGEVARVSRSNSTGMQRLALQLNGIKPTIRDHFLKLTSRLSEASSPILAKPPARSEFDLR